MTSIKHFQKQDLPREKLQRYGPDRLSDAELLAILLRTGTKEMNVIDLAKKVLRSYKGKEVSDVGVDELTGIRGLGLAKASEIVACFELARRMLKDKQVHVLLSPKDVWDRMEDLRNSRREHFVVFYLDSREQEIKRVIVSVGTMNESLVHPREVFESAIRYNAASVIVAHNHPSGDIKPSQDDIEITKKLKYAGKLLNIDLTDHIIVTKDSWSSIIDL